jgi:hypothetical protein
VAQLDTILGWYGELAACKFDGSAHSRSGQNRSKLAQTSCQAFSTIAPGPPAADMVIFFTALLSFVGFDTPSLTGSR